MICDHGRILIAWNEDGSLDEIYCGACDTDVTDELGAEEVMRVLVGEAGKRSASQSYLWLPPWCVAIDEDK